MARRSAQRNVRSAAVDMLSRDEERALACRWRDEGDEAALARLCLAHAPLVAAVARRYAGSGAAIDDLVQEGNVGLLEAARRFDPARSVRFSTYARWWVEAAIREFVRDNRSVVRGGKRAGRAPDPMADIPITAAPRDGAPKIAETLADDRPDPEAEVMARHDHDVRTRHLLAALGDLSDRERLVVEMRCLRERRETLASLGERLGVSKERVRQIEQTGRGKLGRAVRNRMLVAMEIGAEA